MSMFGALDTAATGVGLGRIWMDATSTNVANINTVRPPGEEPFRARLVVAQTLQGRAGVGVSKIVEQGGAPEVVFDPDNPLADENGYVTRPKVELATEMTNMLMAQRLYQANIAVAQQARDSYMAALQIGKR